MNKTAVTGLYNSIPEQAFPLPSLSLGQEAFLAPVTAEFAALFCTARKAEQYGVSATESLSVRWKGSPVQWNPASVQWKASLVQWKDQLRAVESWSSHIQSQNLQSSQQQTFRGLRVAAVLF